MDFDDIADNEDQLYRELLEKEEREKNKDKPKSKPIINNNYDDETNDNY